MNIEEFKKRIVETACVSFGRSFIFTVCLIGQCIREWLFWGRFPGAPSSYINLVRVVYRQRIHNNYLVQFFSYVALLVTEKSHHDQNFWIIPSNRLKPMYRKKNSLAINAHIFEFTQYAFWGRRHQQ